MEIGESQTFQVVGKDRSHTIELIQKKPIQKGAQPGKEFWNANLLVTNVQNKEFKRPVGLVKRSVAAKHFVNVWTRMKEIGLPVLPTVAVISNSEILETDLTADGSKVYGKDSYPKNDNPSPVDRLFQKIDIDEVERKAKEVSNLAATNHIGISADHGFDLLVKPDGSYKVMNRDIKNTRIYKSNVKIEQIQLENDGCVERFIDHLKETKRFL